MKLQRTFACILLIVLLSLSGQGYAQEITDLIQPVKINYGRTDTILVSDLFYAKTYDLQFSANEDIQAIYQKEQNTVVFKPINNFLGATLIEFTLLAVKYQIPIIVLGASSSQQLHTFSYTPMKKVGNVRVTGSFNNWNKERDQLIDTKGIGTYELTLPLDPGNYIYKLIVDGKEIVDPANSEKAPTGFDDFNSVLRISETDTAQPFLHIGSYDNSKDRVSISFIYENTGNPSLFSEKEIIALLDNQEVDRKKITLKQT